MFILFAPSEDKREGGNCEFLPSSLLFGLEKSRDEMLNSYRMLIDTQNPVQLQELFGIKDSDKYQRFLKPLDTASCLQAIERYSGVAYEYLNYLALPEDAQEYLAKKVIIFSNLFGPIRASDTIPDYKFKQGSSVGHIAPEVFYKKHFSGLLDEMIGENEVLDLRAGFYDKFYIPKDTSTTLKFLKEGKVVSHWAKAYRGLVLRECAIHQIKSTEILEKHVFSGLEMIDKIHTSRKKELIFSIL